MVKKLEFDEFGRIKSVEFYDFTTFAQMADILTKLKIGNVSQAIIRNLTPDQEKDS